MKKKQQSQNSKPARRTQKKNTAGRNKASTDAEPSGSDSEQTEEEDSQPCKKPRRLHESEVEEVGDENDDKSLSEDTDKGQEDSEVRTVSLKMRAGNI
jgi:hypothetical protein